MADASARADAGPPRGDATLDGGGTRPDDCTIRCLDALALCGGPGGADAVDCARLCATYAALGTGCETERDALYDCAFGPPCGRCGLVDGPESDALVACIVARNPRPCFAYCRAALAAGCAPGAHDPEDCNCVAQFYATGDANPCQSETDALFACGAEHPCDRAACEAQATALNTCGLGCASGEVGCYVGRSGRCLGAAELTTDGEHCGRCNNPCGAVGTCVDGACVCPTDTHHCPGEGCASDDDPLRCGAACTSCLAPPHGMATCTGGSCGVVCDVGYVAVGGTCVRDCPGGQHACGDACFADDDPTHCGASCAPCATTIPHATPSCVSGSCGFACDAGYVPAGTTCACAAGYHACGASCFADDDPAACGSTCRTCPAPPLDAHRTCTAGTCGYACDAAFVRVGSVCLRCNPFTSDGCSGLQACYLGRFVGMFLCATPSAPRWPCYEPSDCPAGYACLGPGPAGSCYRVCDTSGTGVCDPFAGEVCRMVSYGVPNLGVCVP